MRRKPLFPPPHHPTTGKRLADKGRQSRTVLTINGRIKTYRRWWHGSQAGSVVPVDAIVDPKATGSRRGGGDDLPRELPSTSFERAAAALHRLAQVKLSGERLRQLVEAAGREVLKAQQSNAVAVTWHAQDCVVPDDTTKEKTRFYMGCDGVMVPVITDVQKVKRRQNIKAKRRAAARSASPCRSGNAAATELGRSSRSYSSTARMPSNNMWPSRTKTTLLPGRRCVVKRIDCGSARPTNASAWWTRRSGFANRRNCILAELDALGLDFYHLSENVHRARAKYLEKNRPRDSPGRMN